MDKIAVCIPCYNEEKTIRKVVTDFKRVLPNATIYVYNNNSTDKTVQEAVKAGAVVRHEYQQGKGNVVRRMFREIDADCYLLVDGDGSHPSESAPQMVDLILTSGIDMVMGDRLSTTYATENKRPFHTFGNKLVLKVINLLFRAHIKDVMTGYRAFSYAFVKTFPILSKGFEIETEMTIHALDKNIAFKQIPIQHKDRPRGNPSKLNTYTDGIKVLLMIFKLVWLYKPFLFWGGISLGLTLLSFVFLIPVLVAYFETGLVQRFPTLIVCVFTFIAALQAFFTGMILENIVHKNRQDFELELIKTEQRRKKKNS